MPSMDTTTFPYDTARTGELAQLLIDNVRELARGRLDPGHQQQLLPPPG